MPIFFTLVCNPPNQLVRVHSTTADPPFQSVASDVRSGPDPPQRWHQAKDQVRGAGMCTELCWLLRRWHRTEDGRGAMWLLLVKVPAQGPLCPRVCRSLGLAFGLFGAHFKYWATRFGLEGLFWVFGFVIGH
ncbi:hypothetical protein ES332_A03G105900v1 [Gossypium tomentosum]|uniref:Uncharacterized protein n=1 Tax=Gossypium tomentosum TaxID=34277 RepID=A0A5D2R5K1_GOSTO|nr:hypothetical protein ES332_A03G105900v1 [Gossypium tomentosum]